MSFLPDLGSAVTFTINAPLLPSYCPTSGQVSASMPGASTWTALVWCIVHACSGALVLRKLAVKPGEKKHSPIQKNREAGHHGCTRAASASVDGAMPQPFSQPGAEVVREKRAELGSHHQWNVFLLYTHLPLPCFAGTRPGLHVPVAELCMALCCPLLERAVAGLGVSQPASQPAKHTRWVLC